MSTSFRAAYFARRLSRLPKVYAECASPTVIEVRGTGWGNCTNARRWCSSSSHEAQHVVFEHHASVQNPQIPVPEHRQLTCLQHDMRKSFVRTRGGLAATGFCPGHRFM